MNRGLKRRGGALIFRAHKISVTASKDATSTVDRGGRLGGQDGEPRGGPSWGKGLGKKLRAAKGPGAARPRHELVNGRPEGGD